ARPPSLPVGAASCQGCADQPAIRQSRCAWQAGSQAMKRASGRAQLAALLAALLVLGCLLALGTWQVQRLAWKEALIAQIDSRLGMEPVDVANILALQQAGEDIEYRPVRISGRFDHDR